MSNVAAEVSTEMLQAFADAWNRRDADALMSFMSDDCVIALKDSYRKNRLPVGGPSQVGRGSPFSRQVS